MTELTEELKKDVERIQALPIVPSILELICRTTGMGFSAVARVTEDKWIACAVDDRISFGLRPGGELVLETTICNEIRGHGQPVVIDDVSSDEQYCNHHTPRQYGFRSYISIPIILKDGSFFGTLCAIDPRPFPLKSSNMVTLFNLFADLISYHLLTQEMLQAKNRLLDIKELHIRYSAEELFQYTHISRHTLREPLRKLRLFTDKLVHVPGLPAEHPAKEIALKINNLSKEFTQMIDTLSEFSALDKTAVSRATVDLNDIAESIRLSLRSLITQKDAVIHIGPLPIVEARPEQMTLLFSHLVSNALKFSRRGVRPNISIRGEKLPPEEIGQYLDLDSAQIYCRLRFEDNGIGIERNLLHQIFDLFRKFSPDTSDASVGAGLAQAKKIVRLHHGTITVSSQPGSGSVFVVILPFRQSNVHHS